MAFDPLNRLCKWRTFFAGWQLGTRSKDDPEAAAIRDAVDARLVMRAELTALTGLLIKKNVFTAKEYSDAVNTEAVAYEALLQQQFPGIQATDYGLSMSPEAAETMKRLNFKR